MTRKDYDLLASALNRAYARETGAQERGVLDRALDQLVLVLETDNPRFEADKFREACWANL